MNINILTQAQKSNDRENKNENILEIETKDKDIILKSISNLSEILPEEGFN